MTALHEPVAVTATAGKRRRSFRTDPLVLLSASVCVLLVLLAIVGPAFAPQSPSATNVLAANLPMSAEHVLGTDSLGRDILSRLLHGARLSLLGPAIVVAAATVLGTTLAIASAWWGGPVDRVIARSVDLLFAFPSLLVAILAVAVFGPGLSAPVVALAIAYTPYIARIVRTVAVRERSRPYIDALQLAGLSSWRICSRHILPNVFPIVRAQATIAFGAALVDLAGISFLGLGVQPPSAEWGLMVSDGRVALLNGYPLESIAAGVMIVVAVVAFNVLGERLATRSEVHR